MGEDGSWPSSAEYYLLDRKIGQGAFSSVHIARCPTKETNVAIKVMDLENINSSFEDIRQEVQMMRLSDHPNILRCYSSFVSGRELWLVMQLMDKGSCLHVMTMAKRMSLGEGMKEDWLAYILRETLQGLKYFHDNGQIHRDVKAGNILLDAKGNVRIADFGVSGWLINYGARRTTTKTFVGTPCWMAPEVMEQLEGYDYKADIWSFGITALELAKGYAPYAHYPPMKVLLLTMQQDPPSLKSYPDDKSVDGEPFSRGFREIVRLCLQKDPKKRPNCSYLLNHKYFQKRGKDALVAELLCRLESIGASEVETAPRLPGTVPAYISHENATATVKASAPGGGGGVGGGAAVGGGGGGGVVVDGGGGVPEESKVPAAVERAPEFVKGTTWVFDDGSQVILHSDSQLAEMGKSSDDLEGFFCEFEATTKGENFEK